MNNNYLSVGISFLVIKPVTICDSEKQEVEEEETCMEGLLGLESDDKEGAEEGETEESDAAEVLLN